MEGGECRPHAKGRTLESPETENIHTRVRVKYAKSGTVVCFSHSVFPPKFARFDVVE